MKKMFVACVLLLCVLFSGSFLHAENLDKATIQKAAQKYLDIAYPKSYFYYDFPVTIESNDTRDKNRLEALEKCGLVALIDKKNIQKPGIGMKKVDILQFTYDITEKGKNFIVQTKKTEKIFSGTKTAIAFGKAEIVSIDSFTPEEDFMDAKITKVKFTYKVTNIPEWVAIPEVLAVDKNLKTDYESAKEPVSKKAVFFYKNNEWVHEKLFK